jgi:hypothetical protein
MVSYHSHPQEVDMAAVALLNAEAGSTPNGMGSFDYFTNAWVVVENLAFDKIVGIWGHNAESGNWGFFPCIFDHSVPNNSEIWSAHISSTEIDQFAVEYRVLGNIFWDNNAGFNYRLDTGSAHTDGIGTAIVVPKVLVVASGVEPGGKLNVDVLVKNLAFAKQVVIVYTTDSWTTFHNAFGNFQRRFPPPTIPHQIQSELWAVSVQLTPGVSVQFAVFYIVGGATYWDNNFGANYSI